MLSQKQLLDKKNLYIYYKKVISFKRIKLQKQIENYRNQVSFVKETIKSMENIKLLLNKESKFLSFFEQKTKRNVRNLKNIYIFIQTQDNTNIGKYSDKKILEYIKKNLDLSNDMIYVSGLRLFNNIRSKFKNLDTQLLEEFQNNFSILFEKISEISFTLYSDQIVNNVFLLYSDIGKSKELFNFRILPFDLNDIKNEKINLAYTSPQKNYANKILNDFDVKKTNEITFISEITNINETFLKLLLSSLSKYIIINYLLNMCIRKMINIDDEEKNLDQRIKKNNMDLIKVKNEKITNEMIQIAVARKIIIKRKMQELINKKPKSKEITDETV